MYRGFFGFREPPFRITPDPRCLWRGAQYGEAIDALVDAIVGRRGLATLIGEVGTGKTTIVRHLLDGLPSSVRTVLVLHPTVDFDETLDHILLELGIPVDGTSSLGLLQRLNEFLLEHAHDGGTVVVCFDEAQALASAALAELTLLTDLRTGDGRPAVQILLAGQTELDEKLADPALAPLTDRVAVAVRLLPLVPEDVGPYVRARLEHAGAPAPDLFDDGAIAALARCSGGIPRTINVLCDAALIIAFAQNARRVSGPMIEEAWHELEPLASPEPVPMPRPLVERTATPPLVLPPPAEAAPAHAAHRRPSRRAVALGACAAAAAVVLAVAVVGRQPTRHPAPPTDAVALSMQLESRPPAAEPDAVAADAEGTPALADTGVGGARDEADARAAAGPDDPSAAPPDGVPPGAEGAAADVDDVATDAPPGPLVVADARPLAADAGTAPPLLASADDIFFMADDATPAPVPPPSAAEALAVMDEVRAALEARDLARVRRCFADAVPAPAAAAWTRVLSEAADVLWAQPRAVVAPGAGETAVDAAFALAWHTDDGTPREVRGTGSWRLARRDGAVRVIDLDWRPGAR